MSPYEAWIYKYLREVDPQAAQEDPEDPFMQVASRKGDMHEQQLYESFNAEAESSVIIFGCGP